MGSSRDLGRPSEWDSRDRDRDRDRERRRSRSRDRSTRGDPRRSDRPRSRSPDRGREVRRSKSKSRSRSREKKEDNKAYESSISAVQAMAALQQQQQLQRQMLAQQQRAQQLAAALAAPQLLPSLGLPAAGPTADRMFRQVYVGGLNAGVVTADMLRELFNTILASQVPDPQNQPPVLNVQVDPNAGRFAFVEFRTPEAATASIQLDKLELCGKPILVRRPKGYVEPAQQAAQVQALASAYAGAPPALAPPGPPPGGYAGLVPGGVVPLSAMAAAPPPSYQVPAAAPPPAYAPAAPPQPANTPAPSAALLLENMVTCGTIRNEAERTEILTDVQAEVVKCGVVLALVVPLPPPHVPDSAASRIYVKYSTPAEAQACRAMMHGRKFDDNLLAATFVHELEFLRAQAGEWVDTPGQVVPQGVPIMVVPAAAPTYHQQHHHQHQHHQLHHPPPPLPTYPPPPQ